MTSRCHRNLRWAIIAVLVANTPARAEPLNVAPGSDPGGTAIALITPPFDLNDVSLNHKLARDGEGVAIGWDFSKRPKSSAGNAEGQHNPAAPQIASTLAAKAGLRLVPSFVDPLRSATWAQAVAFVAQTPARIVVVPFATESEIDWIAFRAAAEHFPNLLFIVPAQSTNSVPEVGIESDTGAGDGLGYPAAFHLSNVLSVSPHAIADTDLVFTTHPHTATPEVVLALAVKTLLFCPSKHEMLQSSMTKLQAMAKLGTLTTSQPMKVATVGPPPITPCAEALN